MCTGCPTDSLRKTHLLTRPYLLHPRAAITPVGCRPSLGAGAVGRGYGLPGEGLDDSSRAGVRPVKPREGLRGAGTATTADPFCPRAVPAGIGVNLREK